MNRVKKMLKKLKTIIKKFIEKVKTKLFFLLGEKVILYLLSLPFFSNLKYQSNNIIKSTANGVQISLRSLKDVLVDSLIKILTFLSETLVSKDVIDFVIQLMNF